MTVSPLETLVSNHASLVLRRSASATGPVWPEAGRSGLAVR